MNQTARSSRLSGFHKQSVPERIRQVGEFTALSDEDRALLANTGNVSEELINHLIENVIGTMNIPLWHRHQACASTGGMCWCRWPLKSRRWSPRCAMRRDSVTTMAAS